MRGNYLIPANSKRSMLIFGVFQPIDLIIFGSGIGATLILLLTLSADTLLTVIIVLLPVLVAGFLVLPVPNYHNMRVVLTNVWEFYTTRQQYVWKGWCALDESKDSKK
ncbi:MAG: hypothetical protein IJ565_03670 [Bacilli bacterium]|nr:hypothetical protein [Bacilli bacterium]